MTVVTSARVRSMVTDRMVPSTLDRGAHWKIWALPVGYREGHREHLDGRTACGSGRAQRSHKDHGDNDGSESESLQHGIPPLVERALNIIRDAGRRKRDVPMGHCRSYLRGSTVGEGRREWDLGCRMFVFMTVVVVVQGGHVVEHIVQLLQVRRRSA